LARRAQEVHDVGQGEAVPAGHNERKFASATRPRGSQQGASAMNGTTKRNRLLPWFIGLAINLVVIAFVGGRMYAGECPAPTILEIGVLAVVPIVYLTLMYLTFVSQD
jgi:hypothetical protein